jgi:hypothetical protein
VRNGDYWVTCVDVLLLKCIGQPRSIVATAREVYTLEGVKGFFRGNAANIARVTPVYAVRFSMNDFYVRWIRRIGHVKQDCDLKWWHLFAAGTATGFTQQIISLPLDVVRTRLSAGALFSPPIMYKGIVHCFASMVRTEGVLSLYKGALPTVLSGVPYVAIQMSLFGSLKRLAPKDESTGRPSVLWLLPAGTCAGIVAQTITYPGDTVRKMMMMDGLNGAPKQYATMGACCRHVLTRGGFMGFYGGIGANMMRAVPESTIQYALYEFMKHVLSDVMGR